MTTSRSPEGRASADLVELALRLATLPGLVVVTERTEANLRWANNALTTNGEMRTRSLTVVATAEVTKGTAIGTVSQEITGPDDVAAVVAQAEEIARHGPPSEDAVPLVGADDVAGPLVDPDWDAEADGTTIEVLGDVATALGEAFATAREREQLLFGYAEHSVTTGYLGSSTGLRRRGVQPSGRFEFNGKTAELTASAWVGQSTRDFTDVDVAAAYATLHTRLGWAERRIDLPAGRYETLLPPGAVADLMIYLFWTANARDAEEGRSVFAAADGKTRIGEQLAPLPITMSTDPTYPGLETVPFIDYLMSSDGTIESFDVGLPVRPIRWIDRGVLQELVRNRAHAARTGKVATPPTDNLIVDGGGTESLEDMIASTKRGLLLTTLWYIRTVDPERLLLTGLTRDGVYLIEDGEVVGAVNNFRWNESPVELLGRITEVGATERVLCREWNDWFTRTAMPPVRVPDFNMSTVSQAE